MTNHRLDRLLAGDTKPILQQLLTRSEVGQQMLAELDEQAVNERRKLLAELHEVESEYQAKLAVFNDEVRAASAAREEAQRILQNACNAQAEALSRWNRASVVGSREKGRITQRLLQIVDPQIIDFHRELLEQIYLCRRPRTASLGTAPAQSAMQAALARRSRALKTALAQVEKLPFEPLSTAEIGESIYSIRQSLPPDPGGQVGELMGVDRAR